MDVDYEPDDEEQDDRPPNIVLVWPMQFAQYVKSESARS